MAKCEAKWCSNCGVVHNVEDPCPFEALWLKKYGREPVKMPVGDDYVLEITPVFEADSSATVQKPVGTVADNIDEYWKQKSEPIVRVELPDNLKAAMITGFADMQAWDDALKGNYDEWEKMKEWGKEK